MMHIHRYSARRERRDFKEVSEKGPKRGKKKTKKEDEREKGKSLRRSWSWVETIEVYKERERDVRWMSKRRSFVG